MKKRKRLKKLRRPTFKESGITKEERALYNEVYHLQVEANKRLAELYKFTGTDSWASKKLKAKLVNFGLDAFNENEFIAIGYDPKNKVKLNAIKKAVENFMNSKTSTIKGIKDIKTQQIKSISNLIDKDIDDIENDEAEALYTMFDDDDFSYLTSYIDPSDLIVLVDVTKEKDWSEDRFKKEIISSISSKGSDEDLNEAITNIFNKYIRR